MRKRLSAPDKPKSKLSSSLKVSKKGLLYTKSSRKRNIKQADKLRKKALKAKQSSTEEIHEADDYAAELGDDSHTNQAKLAWVLLALSWLGFISYWLWQNS